MWLVEFKGPNGRTAKDRAEKQQAFRDECAKRGQLALLVASEAELDIHLRWVGLLA